MSPADSPARRPSPGDHAAGGRAEPSPPAAEDSASDLRIAAVVIGACVIGCLLLTLVMLV